MTDSGSNQSNLALAAKGLKILSGRVPLECEDWRNIKMPGASYQSRGCLHHHESAAKADHRNGGVDGEIVFFPRSHRKRMTNSRSLRDPNTGDTATGIYCTILLKHDNATGASGDGQMA